MNARAQIFSLDFMVSFTVAVLALAVAVQAIELNNHANQDAFDHWELGERTRASAQSLVSNEAWTCALELGGGKTVGLDNCIDGGKKVGKEGLGLDAEFGCEVRGLKVDGCEAAPDKAGNVEAVKRVVVFGHAMSAQEFADCRSGKACALSAPAEVEVRVWRK